MVWHKLVLVRILMPFLTIWKFTEDKVKRKWDVPATTIGFLKLKDKQLTFRGLVQCGRVSNSFNNLYLS